MQVGFSAYNSIKSRRVTGCIHPGGRGDVTDQVRFICLMDGAEMSKERNTSPPSPRPTLVGAPITCRQVHIFPGWMGGQAMNRAATIGTVVTFPEFGPILRYAFDFGITYEERASVER